MVDYEDAILKKYGSLLRRCSDGVFPLVEVMEELAVANHYMMAGDIKGTNVHVGAAVSKLKKIKVQDKCIQEILSSLTAGAIKDILFALIEPIDLRDKAMWMRRYDGVITMLTDMYDTALLSCIEYCKR